MINGDIMNKNNIIVSGIVVDRFYSHTFKGIDYYIVHLSVCNKENCNIFKILLSGESVQYNPLLLKKGDTVQIKGYIRSRSVRVFGSISSSYLEVFICAYKVEILSDDEYYSSEKNLVSIEGILCKNLYKHTFMKMRILSGMIACNRSKSSRADYLPIYASGYLSNLIKNRNAGDTVKIFGRLQARTILCKQKEKTVYEIVVMNIKDLPRSMKVC